MLHLSNDSREGRFALRALSKSYLLWFLVAALLAAIVFALCPNNTLLEFLQESLLLAVSSLICYGIANRRSLRSDAPHYGGSQWLIVFYLAFAGVVQFVFTLFDNDVAIQLWAGALNNSGTLIVLIGGLVAISFFTGVFEECLMRGLLFLAIEDEYESSRFATIIAACISSLVFGLLHVTSDFPTAFGMGVVFQLSIVAKFFQASMFGFVMCFVFKMHGIVWCIVAHAIFDFIVFLPNTIAMEMPVVSYATNSIPCLLGIVCSMLLLIPLVLKSYRALVHYAD